MELDFLPLQENVEFSSFIIDVILPSILLKRIETNNNTNKKSEVYERNCVSCPKVYVGQTDRSSKKRAPEYKRSFIKGTTDLSYS